MTAAPLAHPPLRVLIAGGGTGGHLFPGVALAEAIVARGGHVAFVGTARGIEARVIPELGFPLHLVDVAGIKGRGVGGLLRGVAKLPRAGVQALGIVRRERPDVVVGVGGYASGPIVASAALTGRATAILEQNSVAGLTNRLLGRLVRRVFTMFPDARGDFPARKVRHVGNPIRRSILAALREPAAEHRAADQPRLLVFGGSQGARALNDAMIAGAPALLAALPGLEIRHQTGRDDEARVREAYAAAGLTARIRVEPFIREMAAAYRSCDLVVSRAGATSLAELAAVGLPAVLVPFPQATDDHQTHNARSLVTAGAAVLLPQAELDGERLARDVTALLGDRTRLEQMGAAMAGAARADAAEVIVDELERLVRRPRDAR
jgi:UDP-N-acetylglucosamine--N-acetylmuramyl-(pentapeptide) pyrophosphoryl-undecaprenol N-acetylglucosamine transferase